jgi:hypothetical protein
MTPIGALTLGGLSENIGVRLAMVVVASLCGLGAATTWWYLRHRHALSDESLARD